MGNPWRALSGRRVGAGLTEEKHVAVRLDRSAAAPNCRPMVARPCFPILAVLAILPQILAAEAPIERYRRVEVEPTWTSIYIGTVSMRMPVFTRENGRYASTYTAKVFPFFFYGEHGRMSIDVPDEKLRALERGETIEFEGRAENSEGEERRIEGRAVPTDADSGKLKVRVFVSNRIQLIFNTTYRFGS